ncbi:MAG: aminoacyl-tRNA hydrolase [Crocinitomicaceae bacterium]|jgi:ribosome-associated protein|nr:aminoacyl-tRNA hydrolase [Crocinitomicaceae bacterium]MDP4865876.1 aminoacyl-tRNA hydrolase [Crocinitomicaceae bacterium]MDP5011474.1 aminoacyl-tRNA hydrolase [Crocinitomicaceae bacterium]
MKPLKHLLESEFTFKTSRSGGSGGQHVNKVSTKVELDFDVVNSKILTDEQKDIITNKLAARITVEGILQVICQTERSQLRNKIAAIAKFHELIDACFVVIKKRKVTKVSKAVKERRLLAKKRNAEIKKLRRNDFE